jgi:hypothetical protein
MPRTMSHRAKKANTRHIFTTQTVAMAGNEIIGQPDSRRCDGCAGRGRCREGGSEAQRAVAQNTRKTSMMRCERRSTCVACRDDVTPNTRAVSVRGRRCHVRCNADSALHYRTEHDCAHGERATLPHRQADTQQPRLSFSNSHLHTNFLSAFCSKTGVQLNTGSGSDRTTRTRDGGRERAGHADDQRGT